MARPANENSIYRVSIHKNGDYNYATTHTYTIDEHGKRKYNYRHWGKIDENKKFYPGQAFVYASIEERKRLIFPPDWDLSEIERLSGFKTPGHPFGESEDCNRF